MENKDLTEVSNFFIKFSVLLIIVIASTILLVSHYKNLNDLERNNGYETLFDMRDNYSKLVVQLSHLDKEDINLTTKCVNIVDRYNSVSILVNKDMLASNNLPPSLNRVMCEVQ